MYAVNVVIALDAVDAVDAVNADAVDAEGLILIET